MVLLYIPGSDDERGLVKWRQHMVQRKKKKKKGRQGEELDEPEYTSLLKIYEIPRLTKWIEKYEWAKFVPFLHTFDEDLLVLKKAKRKKKRRDKKREEHDDDNDVTTSQV